MLCIFHKEHWHSWLFLASLRYKARVVNSSVSLHQESHTCLENKCSVAKAETPKAQMSGLISSMVAESEIRQISNVYVLLFGGGINFGPCLTNESASPFSCFCGINL